MTSMSGFNVAGNCVMPIARLSRSAARSGAMMAQRRRAAASTIPRRIGQRFFSPDTFIRSTETHQTLETPPPQTANHIIRRGPSRVCDPAAAYRGTEQQDRCRPQGRHGSLSSLSEPFAAYCPGTATEDRGMKHLLNGVAIAAALAIAA